MLPKQKRTYKFDEVAFGELVITSQDHAGIMTLKLYPIVNSVEDPKRVLVEHFKPENFPEEELALLLYLVPLAWLRRYSDLETQFVYADPIFDRLPLALLDVLEHDDSGSYTRCSKVTEVRRVAEENGFLLLLPS